MPSCYYYKKEQRNYIKRTWEQQDEEHDADDHDDDDDDANCEKRRENKFQLMTFSLDYYFLCKIRTLPNEILKT